mmetsp:Transcript_22909/g.48148  ORF Transcript_22909/g.48148 Transcript_22909/m.48148 type:complete len:105 (+) Transcript_22909:1071-1385(+)
MTATLRRGFGDFATGASVEALVLVFHRNAASFDKFALRKVWTAALPCMFCVGADACSLALPMLMLMLMILILMLMLMLMLPSVLMLILLSAGAGPDAGALSFFL